MQLIQAYRWRLVIMTGVGQYKAMIKDMDTRSTPSGGTITFDGGGISSCKEMTMEYGAMTQGINWSDCIRFDVSTDPNPDFNMDLDDHVAVTAGSPWVRVFTGTIKQLPNKWDINTAILNLTGIKDRLGEIVTDSGSVYAANQNAGALIRQILIDTARTGQYNAGSTQALFTFDSTSIPDLPYNITNSLYANGEFVLPIIQKILSLAGTGPNSKINLGVGADRILRIAIEDDTTILDLDTAGYPYIVEWPATIAERPVTDVMWYIGQRGNSWLRYVSRLDSSLLPLGSGRYYKRLGLQNFRVTTEVGGEQGNFEITSSTNNNIYILKILEGNLSPYNEIRRNFNFQSDTANVGTGVDGGGRVRIGIYAPAGRAISAIYISGRTLTECALYQGDPSVYAAIESRVQLGLYTPTGKAPGVLGNATIEQMIYLPSPQTGWFYLETRLSDQYDAVVFPYDRTKFPYGVFNIQLDQFYGLTMDTAAMDALAQPHLHIPNSEPAIVTVFGGMIINPPANIRFRRPDGTQITQRYDTYEYPFSDQALNQTIFRTAGPVDPLLLSQAIAVGLRDEHAAISAFTGTVN